jgi:hypothetical protein
MARREPANGKWLDGRFSVVSKNLPDSTYAYGNVGK